MTAYNTIREIIAKRAEYHRTKREIEALPREIAIEDLGFTPFDAKEIARRAVYG